MIDKMKGANKVKELRELKGLSLRELSEQVSIPRNTIANYEKGLRNLSLDNAIVFSDYFNVPIRYLIGNEEKDPENISISKIEYDNLISFKNKIKEIEKVLK